MSPFRRPRAEPEPQPLVVTNWRPLDADPATLWRLVTSAAADLCDPATFAVLEVPDGGGGRVVLRPYQVDRLTSRVLPAYVAPRPPDEPGRHVTRDETFGVTRTFWVEADGPAARLFVEQSQLIDPRQHRDVAGTRKAVGEAWLTALDQVASGLRPTPGQQWDAVRAAAPVVGANAAVTSASRSFPAVPTAVWAALARCRAAPASPDRQVHVLAGDPLALGAVRLTIVRRPEVTVVGLDEVIDVEPGVSYSVRSLSAAYELDVAVHVDGGGTVVTLSRRTPPESAVDAPPLESLLDQVDGELTPR